MLFVGTMIGLTFVTKKMIGKNTEILDLVEKLRVAKMQKEEAVTNATNKPPETIVDATKTDENIENDQEKQKLASYVGLVAGCLGLWLRSL